MLAGTPEPPARTLRMREFRGVAAPADGLFVRTTTLSSDAAGERVATVALLE
jgi:hypothetical protein